MNGVGGIIPQLTTTSPICASGIEISHAHATRNCSSRRCASTCVTCGPTSGVHQEPPRTRRSPRGSPAPRNSATSARSVQDQWGHHNTGVRARQPVRSCGSQPPKRPLKRGPPACRASRGGFGTVHLSALSAASSPERRKGTPHPPTHATCPIQQGGQASSGPAPRRAERHRVCEPDRSPWQRPFPASSRAGCCLRRRSRGLRRSVLVEGLAAG